MNTTEKHHEIRTKVVQFLNSQIAIATAGTIGSETSLCDWLAAKGAKTPKQIADETSQFIIFAKTEEWFPAEEQFIKTFTCQSFQINIENVEYLPILLWKIQSKWGIATPPKPATSQKAAAVPAPKPEPKPAEPEKQTPAPPPQPSGVTLIDYSDRAIALIGDTKPLKHLLMANNGRYNPRLRVNGAEVKGWVFSRKRRETIQTLIAS